MTIVCYIDNRERELIQLCTQKNINNFNFLYKNLDIGDILINKNNEINEINENNEINETNEINEINENNEINETNEINKNNKNNEINEQQLIIIERKSYDDLSTSIKDGRYKEQKNRILNSVQQNVRKIYILEGNKNDFKLQKNVLEGTIINTMVRDNIHVYISKNIDDTFKFINNILKNIDKYKDNIINNNNIINTNDVLVNSIKKKNMSSETCFMNMLSGIPGISNKTSHIFINKFKNINNMFHYFYKDLENNKELIIKDLENMKVGSNMRKLGNKNAVKIYAFLFD